MPARKSGDESLPSRLFRTHLSNTSSVEDLTDTAAAHKDALDAAQEEHRRVRESALRAYKNNELREAHERLRRIQLQEAERLQLEQERAELAAKVIELQKQKIPLPTPRTPTPPRPEAKSQQSSIPEQIIATKEPSSSPQIHVAFDKPQIQRPLALVASSQKPLIVSESTAPRSPLSRPPAVIKPQSEAFKPAPPANKESPPPKSAIQTQTSHPPSSSSDAEKLLEVHKRLKQLRAFIMDHATKDPALKKKVGEMRREIRKSVGQLTEGRGANKTPMKTIITNLKDALNNTQSPLVDPTMVMLVIPRPVEGAINNGDKLPALFIYLLNIFAKSVISQFMDEAGVSPKTADPIGVVAVSVFAQSDLCWRGASLIDILLCKMRVVCPVLFGIRGSEKTEEGRARLGWWRGDEGDWVPDQVHNTRMTGLGAGYAAISLRDFSKSSHKNPYPPTNYWQTMSSIVNTPPEEASPTQFVVLKAMIENYEQRFMNFYGTAARAALQVALVDFPGRAAETTVAVSALKVLGDKLRRDVGLKLKPYSGKH